jgi:hypothetical protein
VQDVAELPLQENQVVSMQLALNFAGSSPKLNVIKMNDHAFMHLTSLFEKPFPF